MRRTCVVLLASALAGPAWADEAGKPPSLTVFPTQARVEIGADGRVVSVAPDPKLPPLVGDAVRSTIAAWTFAPPRRDGQPVAGVTYVHLAACAAPVDDGLRMAFDYLAHGPGRTGPMAPDFPRELMTPGAATRVKFTYRVQADGTAVVEEVDVEKGNARARGAARASMVQWIAANRFQPELIAGQPVPTRVSLPVDFIARKKTLGSRAPAMREAEKMLQAIAASNPTCQVALAAAARRDRTVVLDSPFTRMPPPG